MQVRNNYDIVWEKEHDPEEEGTGMFNGDVGKLLVFLCAMKISACSLMTS